MKCEATHCFNPKKSSTRLFFVRVLEYEIFSPKCFEIFVKKIQKYFSFTVKNFPIVSAQDRTEDLVRVKHT